MIKKLRISDAVMRHEPYPVLASPMGAVIAAAFVLLSCAAARSQTTGTQALAARPAASQAAQPAGPAQNTQTTIAVQPPAEAATETEPALSAAGHRDPFRPVILLKAASVDELPTHLPPGKPGLVIGKLAVEGIVRGLNGVWIAVVDNQTKRAYFLYQGDQLYNGRVASIAPDSVVFEERFNDTAGRPKTREVVKKLNPQ